MIRCCEQSSNGSHGRPFQFILFLKLLLHRVGLCLGLDRGPKRLNQLINACKECAYTMR